MKITDLFEAPTKKPIPKMTFPGAKATIPQSLRTKLETAVKGLGYSIMGKGYDDGSTSWVVTFSIKKNFNIDKFEADLREKLDYDGWLDVSFFDLEEK